MVNRNLVPIVTDFTDPNTLETTTTYQNLGNADNRWGTLYVNDVDFSGTLTGDITIDDENFITVTNPGTDIQFIQRHLLPDSMTMDDPNDQGSSITTYTRNLGRSANRWNEIHVSNIYVYDEIMNSLIPAENDQNLGSSDNSWETLYGQNIILANVTGGTSNVTLATDTRIIGDIIPNGNWDIGAGSTGGRWSNIFAVNLNINGEITGDLIPQTLAPEAGETINSSTHSIGSDNADNSERWNTLYIHNINATGTLSGDAFSDIDSSNFISINDDSQLITRNLIPDVTGQDPNPLIYRDLGNSSGQRWGTLYVNDVVFNGTLTGTLPTHEHDSILSTNNDGQILQSIIPFGTPISEDIGGQDVVTSYTPLYDLGGNIGTVISRWRNVYMQNLDMNITGGRVIGHLIPDTTDNYNLGLADNRWTVLFTTDVNISGSLTLGADSEIVGNLIPNTGSTSSLSGQNIGGSGTGADRWRGIYARTGNFISSVIAGNLMPQDSSFVPTKNIGANTDAGRWAQYFCG